LNRKIRATFAQFPIQPQVETAQGAVARDVGTQYVACTCARIKVGQDIQLDAGIPGPSLHSQAPPTGFIAHIQRQHHSLGSELFEPGRRGARVLHEGKPGGAIGALHPRLLRELDLDSDVYAFEIQVEPLRLRELPQARPLPRFPSVRRDIAVELPRTVAWAEVEASLRQTLGSGLADTFVFDVYTGPGLKEDQKSIAIGLILQDASRTLTDQDADGCVAAALASLVTAFGAKLRS